MDIDWKHVYIETIEETSGVVGVVLKKGIPTIKGEPSEGAPSIAKEIGMVGRTNGLCNERRNWKPVKYVLLGKLQFMTPENEVVGM